MKFPLAGKVIKRETYVDDIVTGPSSVEETIALRQQLVDLLKLGGFELRKWHANHPSILSDISCDHLVDIVNFDANNALIVNVFRLKWDPVTDSLFIIQNLVTGSASYKRNIISHVARIFDLLDWIIPFLFNQKCIIQNMWLLGLS